MHTNKYEVHINIERCAIHSKSVSELDFYAYVGQRWIQPLYQQWELEAHQGIIGGGTRQIMLFMYKTQVKVCRGQPNAVDDDTSLDLWHMRLTHMS